MAKLKVKQPPVPPQGEEGLEEGLLVEAENPFEQKVAEFHQKFGADAENFKLIVDKWNVNTKKWESAQRYDFDGFDMFVVREVFGPGRYRARFFDGNWKYIKGSTAAEFSFAEEVAPKAAAPAPDDMLKNPIVALLLKQSQDSAAKDRELLLAMLNRPQPTSTVNEAFDMLTKLKNMEPKEGSPLKGIQEALTLMEMMKKLNPEKSGDGGSLISEVMEAVKVLTEAKRAGAFPQLPGRAPLTTAPPPGRIVHMDPNQAPPASQTPEERFGKWAPVMRELALHFPKFEAAAKQNASPEEWADYLLDTLEKTVLPLMLPIVREDRKVPFFVKDETLQDMVLEGLIVKAREPETVKKISGIWPDLAPFEAWVHGVLELAIKELESEAEAAATS